MTAPDMPGTDETVGPDACPARVVSDPVRLRKRREFLAAARARRQSAPGMIVQARRREASEGPGMRVGFTCSKKVGNAVARNRAKRRLREAARLVLPDCGREGWDYVLIGRRDATAARPFPELMGDLRRALDRLHDDRAASGAREGAPAKRAPKRRGKTDGAPAGGTGGAER